MINGYALQRKIREHVTELKKIKEQQQWKSDCGKTRPKMLQNYNNRIVKFMIKVINIIYSAKKIQLNYKISLIIKISIG